MANIKCNGKIETQNLETQSVSAENISTNSLSASTMTSPSVTAELLKANAVTIENISIVPSGNGLNVNGTQLEFVEESGLKINSNAVDSIVDQGDGFIKYANGVQICWGRETDTTNRNGQKTYTVNFKPFIDTNYTIIATPQCTRTDNPYMYVMINIKTASLETTSAEIYLAPTNNSSWHNGCFWLVIGRWKASEEENNEI